MKESDNLNLCSTQQARLGNNLTNQNSANSQRVSSLSENFRAFLTQVLIGFFVMLILFCAFRIGAFLIRYFVYEFV